MGERRVPVPGGWGAFTTAAMRAEGSTILDIRKARRRGELLSVWRGVDVTDGSVPRWRAVAVLSRAGVLAGASAARVWALDVPDDWDDQLVTPPPASRIRSRPGLRVLARQVDPQDVAQIRGVTVTSLARTVADLLREAPETGALWAADQALARGLDRKGCEALLAQPVRGARRARRLWECADARSESPLETAVRLALHRAGVPAPVTQHVVALPVGSARLDFAWPEHRLALEADGMGWHSDPQVLARDRRRQNALVLAGWTVLRATWADVTTDPVGLGELVRRALATL